MPHLNHKRFSRGSQILWKETTLSTLATGICRNKHFEKNQTIAVILHHLNVSKKLLIEAEH